MAHIDHGKSTLADRFIDKSLKGFQIQGSQVLDKLQVEKQRGITVKSQVVQMNHDYKNDNYLLNFVDTPGHSDFSFEVLKTFNCVEGALLLIDATKGIQAQTMANYIKAKDLGLYILPVLNKCDMQSARPDEIIEEIQKTLKIDTNNILQISAKTGKNVDKLMDQICEYLPCAREVQPVIKQNQEYSNLLKKQFLKIKHRLDKDNIILASIFDSWFEINKGVFFLVRVKYGTIKIGSFIQIDQVTENIHEVIELGVFKPNPEPISQLQNGSIGYIFCKIKDPKVCTSAMGKTVRSIQPGLQNLPETKKEKCLVYCSLYPFDSQQYEYFMKCVHQIMLEDPSVQIEREQSSGIGNGIRAGFLGELHLEVFRQRLQDEYDLQTICTPPTVEYKLKKNDNEYYIRNVVDLKPFQNQKVALEEPWTKIFIFCRLEDEQSVFQLLEQRRADIQDIEQISDNQMKFIADMPLSEIIENFNDVLKGLTQGYGSFNYTLDGYKPSKIGVLKITVMDEEIESFQFLVHKNKAYDFGKKICEAFRQYLPSQQFKVNIRAVYGKRIIVKEQIGAMRKDVTAKCYGGDYTRKKKLLERQKEGKKQLQEMGKVKVTPKSLEKIYKHISKQLINNISLFVKQYQFLNIMLIKKTMKKFGLNFYRSANLSKDLLEFREQVEEFSNKEIKPLAEKVDIENKFPDEVMYKMGQFGLLGLTVSEDYGGLDMGYTAQCLAMEEISRASGSIGLSYGAHTNLCVNQLNRFGSDEQKEKFLPKLISGEYIGALAMSEVGSGSDVMSMSTTAVEKDDHYVLNGNKMWITNGPSADVIIVYAKTDKAKNKISTFLIEKNFEGFSVAQKLDKLGMRGSDTGELVFEDCKVPKNNLLGEWNKGSQILMSGLDLERLVLSAGPLGLMQASFDVTLDYIKQRKQFNKAIGEFQLMQGKVAEMYTKLLATRSYLYSLAQKADEGDVDSSECASLIYFASENGVELALEAIQALGGNGYINEYPTGRFLRDAKLYTIGAGTNEIRKWLIGRNLLKY